MKEYVYKLVVLEEASAFLSSLPRAAADKMYYNMYRVAQGERDAEIFKKVRGNIWEFRTLYNKNSYRLFAFWDHETETFIVATHGIMKKTQKTPRKELAMAEAIREQYFNNKK